MSSADKVVNLFPDVVDPPSDQGVQLENGYTRIANELLCAVTNSQTCPVTLRQLRVIMAVIRLTYGYQKKSDRISDGQIAKETGLSRQNVNSAKNQLLEMKVLFLDGKKLGINKHFQTWDFSSKDENTNLKQTRDSVSKPETKKVSKSETHQIKKENLDSSKEESCQKNISDPPHDQIKVRPGAVVQTPNGKKWGTADDLENARHIADQVARLQGAEKSAQSDSDLVNWADECRRLRGMKTTSGKTIEAQHVRALWDFAHQDSFWNQNLLSPGALRKHWERLATQYHQQRQNKKPQQQAQPGRMPVASSFDDQDYSSSEVIPDWMKEELQ